MKQTGICPKCNSKKIGYLENVIHRTDTVVMSHEVKDHCPAPLGLTRSESEGFLKVIKEGPVGKLEAYICGSCGYYETYIKEYINLIYTILCFKHWTSESFYKNAIKAFQNRFLL